MDPDANLQEMRQLTASIVGRPDYAPVDQHDADRLAHLVQSLDAWLKGGNCLPKEWQHGK